MGWAMPSMGNLPTGFHEEPLSSYITPPAGLLEAGVLAGALAGALVLVAVALLCLCDFFWLCEDVASFAAFRSCLLIFATCLAALWADSADCLWVFAACLAAFLAGMSACFRAFAACLAVFLAALSAALEAVVDFAAAFAFCLLASVVFLAASRACLMDRSWVFAAFFAALLAALLAALDLAPGAVAGAAAGAEAEAGVDWISWAGSEPERATPATSREVIASLRIIMDEPRVWGCHGPGMTLQTRVAWLINNAWVSAYRN